MNQKISVEDTALTLAASVADRTYDLLSDGWAKGTLYKGPDGLPMQFCIHGALNLAIEEVFGEGTSLGRSHIDGTRMVTSGASDVEALAVAFIVEEAASQFGYAGGGMFLGAARFNDAPERKLDEVLAVVGAALGPRARQRRLGGEQVGPGRRGRDRAVHARRHRELN